MMKKCALKVNVATLYRYNSVFDRKPVNKERTVEGPMEVQHRCSTDNSSQRVLDTLYIVVRCFCR